MSYLFFHPPRCPGAPPELRATGPNSGPACRESFGWKILLSVPGPISSSVGFRGRPTFLALSGLTSCHPAMPISSRSGLCTFDDGVLLLVVKDDRELRIEVGYGLEGAIPDAVAKRVISEIIVPYFKQGDFYGGIHAGVSRLIRIIDGEPLPPPQARDRSWSGIADLLPVAFIAVMIGGGFLGALLGRLTGAAVSGGIVGVVFWISIGSLIGALAAGVVVFLFTLAAGGSGGRGGSGGWPGGGFGGGSGGWSGGGGGGFSGGGGGFGGGGASGKW